MGNQVGFANGYTDEERLTSLYSRAGSISFRGQIYGGGGPSLYSIGYTVLEGAPSCVADSLEGSRNNSVATAVPILPYQDYSLSAQGIVIISPSTSIEVS